MTHARGCFRARPPDISRSAPSRSRTAVISVGSAWSRALARSGSARMSVASRRRPVRAGSPSHSPSICFARHRFAGLAIAAWTRWRSSISPDDRADRVDADRSDDADGSPAAPWSSPSERWWPPWLPQSRSGHSQRQYAGDVGAPLTE